MQYDGWRVNQRPERPQTQVVLWQELFSPALDPLQDCKQEWNTAEVEVREKLEYLFEALGLH